MAGGKKRDNKSVKAETLPPWLANELRIMSGKVPEVWPNKEITPIGSGSSRVSNSIRPY